MVTLILDIIQSKCISNVTKGITNNPRNESSLPLTTVITTALQITTSDTIITTTTTSVFVETVTLTSTYPSTNAPTNEITNTPATIHTAVQTTKDIKTSQTPTTTDLFPIVCTNSPFQILLYTELNVQAIRDFIIEIITTIKLSTYKLARLHVLVDARKLKIAYILNHILTII